MYRGSPNIEMDEQTFMVNRERAVDYLNSLDKVLFLFHAVYCLLFHLWKSKDAFSCNLLLLADSDGGVMVSYLSFYLTWLFGPCSSFFFFCKFFFVVNVIYMRNLLIHVFSGALNLLFSTSPFSAANSGTAYKSRKDMYSSSQTLHE